MADRKDAWLGHIRALTDEVRANRKLQYGLLAIAAIIVVELGLDWSDAISARELTGMVGGSTVLGRVEWLPHSGIVLDTSVGVYRRAVPACRLYDDGSTLNTHRALVAEAADDTGGSGFACSVCRACRRCEDQVGRRW